MNVDTITVEVMKRITSAKKRRKRRQREERRHTTNEDGSSEAIGGVENMAKEGIVSVEEDRKKKDCRSGNKNFDKDGRFSTKDNATVWSGGYNPRGKDCRYGKWKFPQGKTKKMTRHKCGAKEDGTKEKFRCKDGEKVNEVASPQRRITKDELRYIIIQVLNEVASELGSSIRADRTRKNRTIEKSCQRVGHFSFREFLLKLDAIEKEWKGSLGGG